MDSDESDKKADFLDIYKRLADAWGVVSIQREIKFREMVLLPVEGDYTPVGGAIFLAVLAYPEDFAKRRQFVQAVGASIIKASCEPGSPEREQLRKEPGYAPHLDMPNKRIAQIFSRFGKRFHKRLRAGWVLWQKVISNGDPNKQAPLAEIIKVAARQNTREYPAFDSSNDDEEQIVTSFRQRVMEPCKPVAHLAMAFSSTFENGKPLEFDTFELVNAVTASLPILLEQAETFRVTMGDLFPRHDNQYAPDRVQNFAIPLENTIAVLPYIDPIDPSCGIDDILKLRINASK